MPSFHFVIMLGLSFGLISCKGEIISPPDGKELTFLPGSSENITWKFDDDISEVSSRTWTFTGSNGLRSRTLGVIPLNLQPVPTDNLPGINLFKPATLELNNVNHSYDGIYTFTLTTSVPETHISEVKVYIAKKPNVKIECSNSTTLNKSDDFACVCQGEGGNPPANVTWYKKDVQIGETKKENNTLTLTDVNVTYSGTYTCVALSYPTDAYKDKKSIRITVNSEPYDTTITLKPPVAAVGETVRIECESEGAPRLSYSITHVDTGRVHNVKNLTIFGVQFNDAGTYECFVWNTLGNDSNSDNLTVEESRSTTPPKPTSPSEKSMPDKNDNKTVIKSPDPPMESDSTPIGLIIGIVIGVLLLLLIVGIVVYFYKSKGKDRRNHGNIDPIAGNHYELDEEPSPGDNAYDTVGPMGESGSKKKAPEKDTLPPVYAAVDKNNRQGNTLYASLDTDAMKPKRESKKEPERTPQTEYASIDFAKSAEVPKADLV